MNKGSMDTNDDAQQHRRGTLKRLAGLPGSRTAAAAFVLTVALGLGGPAAYAWWSQQGTATITVTAGKPTAPPVTPPTTPAPSPTPTAPVPTPTPTAPVPTTPPVTAPASPVVPTALTCARNPGVGGSNGGRDTTVSWSAPGAPAGTATIIDIILVSKNGKSVSGTLSYAVPGSSGTVALAALPGIEPFLADAHGKNSKFSVGVRNAWLSKAISAPVVLGGQLAVVGTPSAALAKHGFQYKEKGDWFNCPNGVQ